MKDHQFDVSPAAAEAYSAHKSELLDTVNRCIQKTSGFLELIGGPRNLQVMLDNNRNHVAFMTMVFTFRNYSLLSQTLPWVYRSYHNQGFSYDFFERILECWMEAVRMHLESSIAAEIITVYQGMIDDHERTVEESRSQPEMMVFRDNATADQRDFERFLIEGNQRAVFAMVRDHIATPQDLKHFYENYIRRSMYRIGMLWETGEISVAAEHLSSAIVTRVLSAMYTQIDLPDVTKGRIIVSSAPNEYHEIGAWMVANAFEIDGWDVQYLGANTPLKDLVKIVETFQPDILGLSVTMPYNLEHVQNVVAQVKAEKESTRIFAGGSLTLLYPKLFEKMPVDYVAHTFEDALDEANRVLHTA